MQNTPPSNKKSTNPLAVVALIVGSGLAVNFLFSTGLGSARPRLDGWTNTVPAMIQSIPTASGSAIAVPGGLTQQAQQVTTKSLGVADRVLDTMDSATQAADRVVNFGHDTLDHLLPSKNVAPAVPDPAGASNNPTTNNPIQR